MKNVRLLTQATASMQRSVLMGVATLALVFFTVSPSSSVAGDAPVPGCSKTVKGSICSYPSPFSLSDNESDIVPSRCTASHYALLGQSPPGGNRDTPYFFKLGPRYLKIPWKYMSPRPRSADNCLDVGALGVQFWMPEGEAPERDLSGGHEFRPIEPGHPQRTPEASIARLWRITYYNDAELKGPDNPDNKIANLKRMYGKNLQTVTVGDLLQIQSKAKPNPPSLNLYRQSDSETLLFFCWNMPGDDLCTVDMNIKARRLSITGLVTRSAMKQNQMLVRTFEDLLADWEVPPS